MIYLFILSLFILSLLLLATVSLIGSRKIKRLRADQEYLFAYFEGKESLEEALTRIRQRTEMQSRNRIPKKRKQKNK